MAAVRNSLQISTILIIGLTNGSIGQAERCIWPYQLLASAGRTINRLAAAPSERSVGVEQPVA